MGDWVRDFYDNVDNRDLEAFLGSLSDDVVVKFANNPPAVGKEQVGQAIGGFFESIAGMTHTFVDVHAAQDATVVEADIEYVRIDGAHVRVPSATILHRRGELVDQLRIYIDLAPVFAPASAAHAV